MTCLPCFRRNENQKNKEETITEERKIFLKKGRLVWQKSSRLPKNPSCVFSQKNFQGKAIDKHPDAVASAHCLDCWARILFETLWKRFLHVWKFCNCWTAGHWSFRRRRESVGNLVEILFVFPCCVWRTSTFISRQYCWVASACTLQNSTCFIECLLRCLFAVWVQLIRFLL